VLLPCSNAPTETPLATRRRLSADEFHLPQATIIRIDESTGLTMGTLFLVRHAQASFDAENYDKLSKLGESQARLLGKYWALRGFHFDRVCVGPCVRQIDTAKRVSEAYTMAGQRFPEAIVLPEFGEYQGEAVLKSTLPALRQDNHRIRELHNAFPASCDSARQRASFQKLFEAVIGMWVRGAIHPDGVEAWPEFCARVSSGLARFLSAGGRGEQVVIFTSGGPIAVAMQRALQLSPENTLGVSWMSRNSSWSEFLFDAERLTLSGFNFHGHLDDPAMITYR
jgi:broad specificity phosphatase PhoE